jgi:hypothetical protein
VVTWSLKLLYRNSVDDIPNIDIPTVDVLTGLPIALLALSSTLTVNISAP